MNMRVEIATVLRRFVSREALRGQLRAAGHAVVDFSVRELDLSDDYLDIIVPLAPVVATGDVLHGIAICGSGVGASVCANKAADVSGGPVRDHLSAQQAVQDNNMNIICMGGQTVGPVAVWDLVQTFLSCEFGGATRHVRRLAKVAILGTYLEPQPMMKGRRVPQRWQKLDHVANGDRHGGTTRCALFQDTISC
jgi:ribose 5-phosphate isomerase B